MEPHDTTVLVNKCRNRTGDLNGDSMRHKFIKKICLSNPVKNIWYIKCCRIILEVTEIFCSFRSVPERGKVEENSHQKTFQHKREKNYQKNFSGNNLFIFVESIICSFPKVVGIMYLIGDIFCCFISIGCC